MAAPIPDAPAGHEFVITRVFDAPRDVVWKAWTEAERLKHWWGPKGFTMLACMVGLRPGGLFHYGMKAPNGFEMWGKFVYREITAPERLVFVVSFSDKERNTLRHFASTTWPLEVLNTVTFTEQGGKTTATLKGAPINATGEERKTFEAGFGSMEQGFKGTLNQLADYLAQTV
jgi:uncharacterized protein YndB with AHSA1/START domain